MWSLFRYFYRHHVVILFLFLEIVGFILIFSYNSFQRAGFINSSAHITGNIYDRYSAITDYFNLSVVNRQLAEENARLRESLLAQIRSDDSTSTITYIKPDSLGNYQFIPARVINNSVNRQHNFITLNKGARHGIRPDMGVLTPQGIAGVVSHVSDSYSVVISMLNLRWNVSAKLKRNNYFGSLTWDGKDYRYALLNEIPFHVDLLEGDTIVTSGFSSIFPEGMPLGIIESFKKEGGDNFYQIRVQLSVDFKAVTYVEVIDNRKRPELDALEKLSNNGKDLD
jgi:rod shape-determining protein MreC